MCRCSKFEHILAPGVNALVFACAVSAFGFQPRRISSIVGRMGSAHSGDRGQLCSIVADAELGTPRKPIFRAGLADWLFCQSRTKSARELAFGGSCADAGRDVFHDGYSVV